MHMSTSHPSRPVTPREQPCGQYTLYDLGNSVTVTVPKTSGLVPGTSLSLRTGWYNGQLLYLKAVPVDAAPAGQSLAQPTPMADGGDRVTETSIEDLYTVREGDPLTLTIPAKCETDQFAVESAPMLVAGRVEGALAYLKLIPEALYTAVGSIALSDYIEHSATDASPPEPSVPSSQTTFADFHD